MDGFVLSHPFCDETAERMGHGDSNHEPQITSHDTLHLGFEIGDHVEEALIETAVAGNGFLDRNVCDV